MKKKENNDTINTKSTKKSHDSFTIKIPRFTFKDTKINIFLVFTLIIFSFLLGMLTNKVISLEEQLRTGTVPTTADQQQAEIAIPTPPPVVEGMTVGKLPTLGNKNAKVTVVEFSDFQCPFCKRYFDDTFAQLKKTYIDTGKIQFAYRNFPLSSIHPNAQKAAEAAECANAQGQFWGYHDTLFTKQDDWSSKSNTDALKLFTSYAGELGMNTDQFISCLSDDTYKQQVADDASVGTDASVTGTPTFFINGKRIVGAVPFSELKKLIEEELKK